MRRKISFGIVGLLLSVSLALSCRNEHPSASGSALYGSWKTSYGDTIRFAQENGKNILTYNISLNSGMPGVSKNEFSFHNDQLRIQDGGPSSDFRLINTFKWKQRGQSFEVQGIEWFMFLSSTTTYFTFTKL